MDLERQDAAQVGAWLTQHRAEILTALRGCDRDGLRRLGTRLAYAIWPVAGLVPDPRWWQELAGAGEALAIADRDAGMLAGLLHRSAATFAEHGDRLRAEEQWVRALSIIRRGEPEHRDRGVAVLTGLSALYRQWGRLSKALDADLGLVDLQRAAADPVSTASALVRVAATMQAAGRPGSAADYLAQADESISPVTAGSPKVQEFHARILMWWGRALWEHGDHGSARRRWSRALAMLIDVDDTAADHVRTLLATAPADPLPSGYPIADADVPNTSSSSSGGIG